MRCLTGYVLTAKAVSGVAHNGAERSNDTSSGCLVRYIRGSPHSVVEVPDVSGVTACTFGGDDFCTLFITTMRDPRFYRPNAGALFCVEVDVPGVTPTLVDRAAGGSTRSAGA
jgi:sugar lactone lactonase YvrE